MSTAKLSAKKQTELIEKEIDRILILFRDADEDLIKKAMPIIERVAFMTITLQELEKVIKRRGAVYQFVNGKQRMLIENPAQKSYNTTMNRYTAAYNVLYNLLNQINKDDDSDGFKEV